MATITSPRPASPAIPIINSPPATPMTDTPVSSVRTSIDLPSNQQSTSGNPNNQRRNRAALRDYYNLKTKPQQAGHSPVPSTHNLSRTASVTSTTSTSSHITSATITTDAGTVPTTLPSTLDDPSFDADAYIANLLKTSSLKDILRTESQLVSEVRNLDGERKALVYDNYSKLIVAVGTIGEMTRGIVDKTDPRLRNGSREDSGLARMQGLEGKLDSLMKTNFAQQSRRDTTNTSSGRNGGEEHRKEREERRNKDLARWVLGSPQRLRDYVQEGRKTEAEQEWVNVQTLLDRWNDVKGVEEVRQECRKALDLQEDEEENDDDNDDDHD